MPATRDFWELVSEPQESGCRLWLGPVHHTGYGVAGGSRRRERAHRRAWRLTNGPIEGGLHVLHRCDVRLCVEPTHLFLGTNADNVRDRQEKQRQATGSANSQCRISSTAIAEIRAMRAAGASATSIARALGVSIRHTYHVINGERRRLCGHDIDGSKAVA